MRPHGAVLLLLAAGCAVESEVDPDAPQAWTGTENFEGATPWNRDARSGLAVRAVAEGPHVMGAPVVVRVEAKNLGDRAVVFDAQGLIHQPYELVTTGRRVPSMFDFIGGTSQSMSVVEPGRTKELAVVDLAHHYALLQAGDYTFRFRGLGTSGLWTEPPPGEGPPGSIMAGIPESPPLRIRLAAGPLRPRDLLVSKLLPRLPENWKLQDQGAETGLHLVLRNEVLCSGGIADVPLLCGGKDLPGFRRLGTSAWGEVRLGAAGIWGKGLQRPEAAAAEERFRTTIIPDLERRIRAALEIQP
jgi:hypothetical protein